jgi:hypothetical protein
MQQGNVQRPAIESFGPPLILASVVVSLVILNVDSILATVKILLDPDFLLGFAFVVVQVAVVSFLEARSDPPTRTTNSN